jgi:hypothetical protein
MTSGPAQAGPDFLCLPHITQGRRTQDAGVAYMGFSYIINGS